MVHRWRTDGAVKLSRLKIRVETYAAQLTRAFWLLTSPSNMARFICTRDNPEARSGFKGSIEKQGWPRLRWGRPLIGTCGVRSRPTDLYRRLASADARHIGGECEGSKIGFLIYQPTLANGRSLPAALQCPAKLPGPEQFPEPKTAAEELL